MKCSRGLKGEKRATENLIKKENNRRAEKGQEEDRKQKGLRGARIGTEQHLCVLSASQLDSAIKGELSDFRLC